MNRNCEGHFCRNLGEDEGSRISIHIGMPASILANSGVGLIRNNPARIEIEAAGDIHIDAGQVPAVIVDHRISHHVSSGSAGRGRQFLALATYSATIVDSDNAGTLYVDGISMGSFSRVDSATGGGLFKSNDAKHARANARVRRSASASITRSAA